MDRFPCFEVEGEWLSWNLILNHQTVRISPAHLLQAAARVIPHHSINMSRVYYTLNT